MALLNVVIILIVVAFLWYLAQRVIPMDATLRQIITVVIVIAVVVWLLGLLGIMPTLGALRVGR